MDNSPTVQFLRRMDSSFKLDDEYFEVCDLSRGSQLVIRGHKGSDAIDVFVVNYDPNGDHDYLEDHSPEDEARRLVCEADVKVEQLRGIVYRTSEYINSESERLCGIAMKLNRKQSKLSVQIAQLEKDQIELDITYDEFDHKHSSSRTKPILSRNVGPSPDLLAKAKQ